ncbi:hypothetical protein WKG93_08800 [Pantoea agglomerans]|uniref:hypothetical protein n=1 Tax=Enterobacter agglomerans TaxID=549 RepID=UPI0023B186C6|nr:hypothetical protein [Pantoea agglomerans]WEC73595.1 hypothetical protein LDO72_05875 [Pantoea agglomerans]
MRERPILFNADMVRAVLDGRKTQTRRIMREQPEVIPKEDEHGKPGFWIPFNAGKTMVRNDDMHFACPFGLKGERLWVRETFRVHSRATDVATLVYKASEQQSWTQQTHRVPIEKCNKPAVVDTWTPSIHMPRWASRITLEITGVRVERLRDLSEEDAKSEGVIPPAGGVLPGWEHRINFRDLWMSIYGADNWEANPWVWVVEFKRVEVE